jgi:hypothetical protein
MSVEYSFVLLTCSTRRFAELGQANSELVFASESGCAENFSPETQLGSESARGVWTLIVDHVTRVFSFLAVTTCLLANFNLYEEKFAVK